MVECCVDITLSYYQVQCTCSLGVRGGTCWRVFAYLYLLSKPLFEEKAVPTLYGGREGGRLCALRYGQEGSVLKGPSIVAYTCKSALVGASLGPSMLEDDVVHYLELSTTSVHRR